MGTNEKGIVDSTERYIDKEARLLRQQELEMARVNAERDMKLAQFESNNRAGRREFLQNVLVGVAIVSVILGIVGGMVFGVTIGDRENRQHDLERARLQQKTAEKCIVDGGAWVDDDCIFSKQPAPKQ